MYGNMPAQPQYYPAPGNAPADPLQGIKYNERRMIKKASNGVGFYLLAYFLLMQISAVIVYIVFDAANIKTKDPFFEYMFDIFLSVASPLIPALLYLLISRFRLGEAFKKTFVAPTVLIPLVFIGMGMALVSNVAAQIFDDNISLFGLQNTVSMTNEYSLNTIETVIYVIAVSVVPALAEEFAFRGIVMGRLKKYGNAFAIIASAVLFGAMHGNTTQVIFAFILGLIFGYIDCVTDSIIPSVIVHFVNNFYAVVFDVLETNTGISETGLLILQLAVVLIFCIGGLLSFIYLAGRDKSFFKLSSKDKSDDEYADLLTFKEKLKSFFFTPGVIIALVMFFLTVLINLIPMS